MYHKSVYIFKKIQIEKCINNGKMFQKPRKSERIVSMFIVLQKKSNVDNIRPEWQEVHEFNGMIIQREKNIQITNILFYTSNKLRMHLYSDDPSNNYKVTQ